MKRAEGVLLKIETFGWLRGLYVSTKRTGVAIVGCRRHRRWWEYGFMLKGLLQGDLDLQGVVDIDPLRPAHHEVCVDMDRTGFLGRGKEYDGQPPQSCKVVTSYWLERAGWLLDDGAVLAGEVLSMLKNVGHDLR